MNAGDVFFQQLINGVTIGMIYALIALGYTIVYGIVQLINFAHGEVFMVGAYLGLLAYSIANQLSLNAYGVMVFLPIIFLFTMSLTALLGFTIERFAYQPLRNAPRLAPLITAIGVSFLLQNAVMIIVGPSDQSFPSLLEIKKYYIGPSVTITNLQCLISFVSIVLMVGLHLFIKHTQTGRAMRALADDRQAASLMGINVNKIISIAFLIGSALAGAGGVMFAMYYNTINFHDGYLAGLKAFTAAVFGGIGNIPGAMIGGVLIGVFEGLGAGYLSSEWKNVFAFFILILILLFRPSGLLGSRVVKKV